MKVLVTGGRSFGDKTLLDDTLSQLNRSYGITEIIEGGAAGADWLARKWAVRNKISYKTYPANWQKHGRSAGPIRNKEMLEDSQPDLVVAFPGGKGTSNMIILAGKAKVRTLVISNSKSVKKIKPKPLTQAQKDILAACVTDKESALNVGMILKKHSEKNEGVVPVNEDVFRAIAGYPPGFFLYIGQIHPLKNNIWIRCT